MISGIVKKASRNFLYREFVFNNASRLRSKPVNQEKPAPPISPELFLSESKSKLKRLASSFQEMKQAETRINVI